VDFRSFYHTEAHNAINKAISVTSTHVVLIPSTTVVATRRLSMKIPMIWGPFRFVEQLPLNYGSNDDLLGLDDNSDRASCSSMSLYSYHSERDAKAFVYEASGRRYNKKGLYLLPSDQSEFSRQ
jgi:hypothetical protein